MYTYLTENEANNKTNNKKTPARRNVRKKKNKKNKKKNRPGPPTMTTQWHDPPRNPWAKPRHEPPRTTKKKSFIFSDASPALFFWFWWFFRGARGRRRGSGGEINDQQGALIFKPFIYWFLRFLWGANGQAGKLLLAKELIARPHAKAWDILVLSLLTAFFWPVAIYLGFSNIFLY